jgi:hypothetical protein
MRFSWIVPVSDMRCYRRDGYSVESLAVELVKLGAEEDLGRFRQNLDSMQIGHVMQLEYWDDEVSGYRHGYVVRNS